MKALVLSAYGTIRPEERPTPTPAGDEILLEVESVGICGSDIHGYTGENGRRQPGQIMGHEAVGRIAALGAGLVRPDLRPGQAATFNPVVRPEQPAGSPDPFLGREQHDPRKYVIGVRADRPAAFAQFIAVPARNVVALPDSMPIEYGALVEPLAVATHAVNRAGVSSDDSVLVLGGGPIGQSVVLALRRAGVRSIVVSELEAGRRALVESLGATVVDPGVETPAAALVNRTGGLADVAIDAVGATATIGSALLATRPGAVICLLGMASPEVSLQAYRISTEERSIVGSFTYSDAEFAQAAAWAAEAPPELAALISRTVPYTEANDQFRALAAGDGTPGKVLVRMREDRS